MKAQPATETSDPVNDAEPERASGGEGDELPPRLASILAAPAPAPAPAPAAAVAPALLAQLGLARVIDLLPDGTVELRVGGQAVIAERSPTLHASVLKTALAHGDPVLVERDEEGRVTVMGALRTQPTPGVDAMEEVNIEAERIHLRGRKEIALSTSGAAQIALRAIGEVETYAERIVSRAEEVHKIVGRMLRLN